MDECGGAFNDVTGEEIREALNMMYESEYFVKKICEEKLMYGFYWF